MPPHGTIVNTRTIVDHGNPACRFDIVILAEGFRRRQLRAFDKTAKLLAARLLAMPPFCDVADLINVHTIRTASTDSGVSQFPDATVKKNTYYNVIGSFPVPGIPTPPSFLGTHTPELIFDAASRVAPLETLELFIVVANIKAFAACAFPDQQIVYTGLHETNADLVNFTAHECGHAIAQTAEEYLDCNGPTPGKVFRNQATEAQRLAKTVWWKSRAKKSEIKVATGAFKAVHLFGDPNVHFGPGHTPIFDTLKSRNGMLGLYWGCQDIDPGPGTCHGFQDPRGRNYYRPMAACRMRNEKSDFCRVCSYLMTERIRAVTL